MEIRFKSMAELVAAIAADDHAPDTGLYRLFMASSSLWLVFAPEPGSRRWVQTRAGASAGKVLTMARALNRIMQEIRDWHVDDGLARVENDRLVQRFRIVKVETDA